MAGKQVVTMAVLAVLGAGALASAQMGQAPGQASQLKYVKAFNALWQDMDRNYSYFSLKKVNWKALGDQYRPKAAAAKSDEQFVEVLKQMLANLKDMHVWIQFKGEHISPWGHGYRLFWNAKAVSATFETDTQCGKYAIVGKTKGDGFGYVILVDQGRASDQTVRQTVEEIRKLKDVPGFIVDLRPGAFGGSEPLARPIAELFCTKETVYARHKVRSGLGHEDFTKDSLRTIKGSPDAYARPVICLIGDRCMSSGEALVQMFACLPHVTTLGDRTRGSSGNPKTFELPGLPIQVDYSRWVDMMPDGKPVEGVGIAPQVPMALPSQAFQQKDPVWDRATLLLRQKVAQAKAVVRAPASQP